MTLNYCQKSMSIVPLVKVITYKKIISVFFFCLLGLLACRRYEIEGAVKRDPRLSGHLLALAQDTITLEGHRFFMQADAYRDYFQGVLPRAHPLTISIRIFAAGNIVQWPDILLNKVYAIREDEVWTTLPDPEVSPNNSVFSQRYIGNNGPEWPLDTAIDVISEWEDTNHQLYYLKATDVLIERIQ